MSGVSPRFTYVSTLVLHSTLDTARITESATWKEQKKVRVMAFILISRLGISKMCLVSRCQLSWYILFYQAIESVSLRVII